MKYTLKTLQLYMFEFHCNTFCQVYELVTCKNNHQRAEELQEWRKTGGVMIMGYQIFRILATTHTRSKKKKELFDQSLQDPGTAFKLLLHI